MKRIFILFLFVFSIQFSLAQNNLQWRGYFSYNEIKDVAQSESQFFAASENALFSKSTLTNLIKTTNTINGFPSQTISAIFHSPTFQKTLVGYENGLLVVVNENDGTILNVVDIINKQIAPNIKKINHFNESNGIVYIACDFGIVQYNLATLQFGDTYFIGSNVPEIIVNQTAVFDGYIYAATLTEGLKRAEVTNPNLIDANQWIKVNDGNFLGVTNFKTHLFTSKSSGEISKSENGTVFSNFGTLLSPAAVDIRSSENRLVITSPTSVFVYNDQLVLTNQINKSQITTENVTFSCGTVLKSTIYIGTTENGIITLNINNPTNFEFISPNGPARNSIFSINANSSNLWATYGEYNQFVSPRYRSYGFDKYTDDQGWKNIPFSKVDGAVDLVRLTVSPTNENKIFISSFHSGLLEFEDDQLIKHYTQTNSGLESLVGNFVSIRIEQSAFDKEGNLWLTNGLVKNGLKVLKKNDQWQSFNMENILSKPLDGRFTRLTIDRNSTKWICTLDDGLIAYNETYNNVFKKINENSEDTPLPSNSVQAVTVDNRNQLWIGTRKGLRVISSVSSFLSEEPLKAYPIIIVEEGLPQELLFEQFITDIVVDGANNKWVSTADAGVFQFSPNGQSTLYHFTTSNSPLPSNNVNDVDINQSTGEVFFATTKGMVSFQGTAISESKDLSNVIVYPNPVRPEYSGTVKITGVLDKANIKITDIEGNLVYEVISEGGSIEWDTTAFGKYKVATGVYMIFISAQDGIETKVKKVMIIR
jgi:ligand-binding sensor domain-containing protein